MRETYTPSLVLRYYRFLDRGVKKTLAFWTAILHNKTTLRRTTMFVNCCICNTRIVDIDSNNAQPVRNGRCCFNCNANYVIPKRIALMQQQQVAHAQALRTTGQQRS